MPGIRMGSLHGGEGEGSHFITTGPLSKEGVGGGGDVCRALWPALLGWGREGHLGNDNFDSDENVALAGGGERGTMDSVRHVSVRRLS
jgi:hypothetical protein